MALKTKIKVGNITNLSDARYCAGMGVDMLGFKINETEGTGISTVRFKEIANWVSGPEFVLEISEFPEYRSEVNDIGFIELPASRINELNGKGFEGRVIITIDSKDWPAYKKDLLVHKNAITFLLITNTSGIAPKNIKAWVQELAIDFAVLLGGDIRVDELDEYLTWPITGIALNGSEETSPGIKDYDHLSSILEKLEVD